MTSRPALRDLLVAARLVDEGGLVEAEEAAARAGVPLVHALCRLGVVEDRKIARLLSTRLGLERVDLETRTVHPEVLEEVAWRVALKLRALPLSVRRGDAGFTLYAAMSDPTLPGALDELSGITGMEVHPLVVEDGALDRALRRHYPDAEFPQVEPRPAPVAAEDLPTLEPLDDAPLDAAPLDEGSLDEGPPIVVGAILEEPTLPASAPYLMDSTADAIALYAPHMGPHARRSFHSREGEPSHEEARAQASLALPDLGGVAVVSSDVRLSRFVAASLAPLARAVHEAPSLARVRELMRQAPVEHVVLLDPRRDVVLEGALRDLREVFNPPKVVVVSADGRFDELVGVALRVPPPVELELLPGELVRALKRIRA